MTKFVIHSLTSLYVNVRVNFAAYAPAPGGGGAGWLMGKCTAITRGGGRCRGVAIDGSGLCYSHHPDHEQDRLRAARKGGKAGGRGRPSTELHRLKERFEELADKVLAGEVERADGAVAGQLLSGARACVRDGLAAKEQEEVLVRMERIEDALEERNRGGGLWDVGDGG